MSKNPLLVYKGNKPINTQVLHDDIEDLSLPEFRGVTIRGAETNEPTIEIYLGPVIPMEEARLFEPRVHTEEEVAQIEALIANHDHTRKTKYEKKKDKKRGERKALSDKLKAHPDPVIQDLAVLLGEEDLPDVLEPASHLPQSTPAGQT
jgi:hypothetical protein